MPGQIIPRGKSTWLLRVFTGRDPQTGKRQYYNETFHGGKKDAETKLSQLLTDQSFGRLESGRVLIGELLDDLLADYSENGRSIEWAKIVCNVHLRPTLGKIPAGKIKTTHIKQYVDRRREKGRSNATINRELSLLRRAFSLGAQADPPKVNRVPRIAKFEENNVRKGFFERSEYLAIRAELPDDLKPVLTFGYYTGFRKAEILGLKWSQVDLLERTVRLEPGETKNREAREIPLEGELYETLKLERERRDRQYPECPWVFSRNGEQILEFKGAWAAACVKCGLADDKGKPTRLFHDLRRTGVRNLVRAGVSEKVAMEISGHRTRAVFDRYHIVTQDDLRDAMRRLRDYHAEKAEPSPAENRHTIGTQRGAELPN